MDQAVEAFGELVALDEAELTAHLDEALLQIAAAAQPGLDVPAEIARIDALAADAPGSSPDDLAEWLFASGKFVGNSLDYYDVENSYLNRVLDLRRGIPISLSVLFIEIGRRLAMEIEPIGMPGHFLTQIAPNRYVDPFNGGVLLDRDGCEQAFQRIAGQRVPLPPGSLAHTPRLVVVQRVLANLRGIGQQTGDAHVTEVAVRMRAAFPSPGPGELLELAGLLASNSRWGQAANAAERAADLLPDQRAERIRTEATQWRARLN